uniref:cell adhesion molecule 1-like isoform X2 n=2 Tax=Myxine glutinosa TaxID=7769 RepID=UPI00358E35D7
MEQAPRKRKCDSDQSPTPVCIVHVDGLKYGNMGPNATLTALGNDSATPTVMPGNETFTPTVWTRVGSTFGVQGTSTMVHQDLVGNVAKDTLSENHKLIIGVVVVAVLILLCLLVLGLRYCFHHRGAYRTREDKGSPLTLPPLIPDSEPSQSSKEYFV